MTAVESKQLVILMKKLPNPKKGLDHPIFDALCGVVPFVACELVIVGPQGMLLTWRQDRWWKGWHFPGGILRYRENFEDRIAKVASSELGIRITDYKLIFPINFNKSKRCHAVSLVFLCHTDDTPKHGKYFTKMPKDIIPEHKELWKKVIDAGY